MLHGLNTESVHDSAGQIHQDQGPAPVHALDHPEVGQLGDISLLTISLLTPRSVPILLLLVWTISALISFLPIMLDLHIARLSLDKIDFYYSVRNMTDRALKSFV